MSTNGPDAGGLGVQFDGHTLEADDPATPEIDVAPVGKAIPSMGSAACYVPVGEPGEGPAATWTYRADVLRYFETDLEGTPETNPNYGKLRANGHHHISVPDAVPRVLADPSPSAPAWWWYRVSGPATPRRRDLRRRRDARHRVPHPGAATRGLLRGVGHAQRPDLYLVGSGQKGRGDSVTVPGAPGPYLNVFKGWDEPNWDTVTYPALIAPGAATATTVLSNLASPIDGGPDCLTPAAMVLKVDVQDTDGDGLLDVWERSGASGPVVTDPTGAPLPALGAMGADPHRKDVFLELGYMHTAGVALTYGGVARPAHSHLPTHAALKMVGDAFANAPVINDYGPGMVGANGIGLHIDVGPGYPPGDPADPAGNAEAYLVRARGGDAIPETACQPEAGAPVWECQFAAYPGTIGWKSGFRFLRDQVLAVNGAPPPADFDEAECGVTVSCERRFDAVRHQSFHYALFAHGIGLPKSELACLRGGVPEAAGADDRCLAGASDNPDFHAPRTNTGIGDFPGGDLLITLGGFDDVDGRPVGTPFMQASTLMHELGHNFERRHGGEAREPNCKPTYLSVMNYLYQLRGLLTDDGVPHLDYSGALGATVDEAALDPLAAFPPYRLGWYAPLEGSYREGRAMPAARHCNGSDLMPTDLPMVRVDARNAADAIDWDADGTPATVVSAQDVNFSGVPAERLESSVDWTALLLNQVAMRRNVGGLFVDPGTGALVVGPLSADVGKGDLGKGDLGKGDLGKGDLGKGDLGKGDLGKGDLGKGDLGKGDLGKGDLGGGDLFLNDPDNPSGELDADTAGDLARTPPNALAACVIGTGSCGTTGDPRNRVLLTWASSNTGGDPVSYRVVRVDGPALQNGQPWTLVAEVPAGDFDRAQNGVRFYSAVDQTTLVAGQTYTYFAIAVHGPMDESDLSNLVTITAVGKYAFVPVAGLPPTKSKAGATMALKWRYQDGDTVLDTASLSHTVTVCRVVGAECVVVDRMTNSDPGNSGFRYADDTWKFNFQLKDRDGMKYPVGVYQLTIQPSDDRFEAGGPYPFEVTR
ncbi:MAG: hypothetical protein R2712_28595 [Vicinamibacterales bacterium]